MYNQYDIYILRNPCDTRASHELQTSLYKMKPTEPPRHFSFPFHISPSLSSSFPAYPFLLLSHPLSILLLLILSYNSIHKSNSIKGILPLKQDYL